MAVRGRAGSRHSQPVLSVLGTQTERWFVEGHDLLHAWFPQVEDCTIDGVGHLLHMQRPEPVARCMAGFFADADDWFSSYLPALNAWRFGDEQAAIISQPVLSVVGMQTERWFVDGHDQLHAWFPQVEDCTIDGVGHLLHMQRPEPMARCMAEFFARHPMDGRNDLGERQLLDSEAGEVH